MDERRQEIKSIFSKFSGVKTRVYNELEAQKNIDNVFGFISSNENVEQSNLIANIAVSLAKQNYNVCVVDHKVFYPDLYKLLGCNPPPKGQGVLQLFRTDKAEYTDHILKTKHNNLFLLSASPQDLFEQYFDIELHAVARVIEELKQMFDYVIIDIPNNPPFEVCVGSIENINLGFFVWNEHIQCAQNTIKFLDYISSIGLSTAKLTNIILNNLYGLPFDKEIIRELGFRLVGQFPHRKEILNLSLDGKCYLTDATLIDKRYKDHMDYVIQFLTKTI